MPVSALTARFFAALRGGLAGDKDILETWAVATPLESTFTQVLTQGAFNTITLPSGCTLVIVIPPTANAQAVTLKGVTGDTGTTLLENKPTILAVKSGTASIGITLGAGSNQTFTFVCI